jgi:hypothetical protein
MKSLLFTRSLPITKQYRRLGRAAAQSARRSRPRASMTSRPKMAGASILAIGNRPVAPRREESFHGGKGRWGWGVEYLDLNREKLPLLVLYPPAGEDGSIGRTTMGSNSINRSTFRSLQQPCWRGTGLWPLLVHRGGQIGRWARRHFCQLPYLPHSRRSLMVSLAGFAAPARGLRPADSEQSARPLPSLGLLFGGPPSSPSLLHSLLHLLCWLVGRIPSITLVSSCLGGSPQSQH